MAKTGRHILAIWIVITGQAGHPHIIICDLSTHAVKFTDDRFTLQDDKTTIIEIY